MSTPFNEAFKSQITALIAKVGTAGRITHLADGTRSACVIAFSGRDENDVLADGYGTTVGEQVTAYITDVNRDVVVGDSVVANKLTYRIGDVKPYQPAGLNIAYKVLLDL